VHWKVHKSECKALRTAGDDDHPTTSSARNSARRNIAVTAQKLSAATSAHPAHAATASASDGGACIICLDSDPLPIQSGCACRGDAGLAHVECRAEAAAHRIANSNNHDGWWRCGTCGQPFTGAMELELAKTWRSTTQRLPKDDHQKLSAADNLSAVLISRGRHAEAVTLSREVLAAWRRILGPEHPNTLKTACKLARALAGQGKKAHAEAMYRETLVVQRRVLGPEDPFTLILASSLARVLYEQDKFAEAVTMYRELLEVRRRVLGNEHPDTLTTIVNLAGILVQPAEAEAMYREVLVVQRRLLGPEHPSTLLTKNNIAIVLLRQGNYVEAETMLREMLAVRRRVQGNEHPDTLLAARHLAACVHSITGIPNSAK
jgi:tetratricopeptide (TPR) repeat protein